MFTPSAATWKVRHLEQLCRGASRALEPLGGAATRSPIPSELRKEGVVDCSRLKNMAGWRTVSPGVDWVRDR